MGADINAQVGIRDKEEYRQVLGPHGIDRRNTRGKVLLDVYNSHGLRVENTFFQHNNYTTYVSMNEYKTKCMLDVIVCSQDLHND